MVSRRLFRASQRRHVATLPAQNTTDIRNKAIGAAQDAARMERVVNFYAGLPRGPAPEVKATGLIGRYQARYFGKNASGVREYILDLRDNGARH